MNSRFRCVVSLPNGIVSRFRYDEASRLTSIRHTRPPSNAALCFFDYEYDNMGNRTKMRDIMGLHVYSYDRLYRLTGVVYPANPAQAYSYDPAGNRLSLTETGKPAQFYQYNEMNELRRVTAGTQETEYTFDAAGNLAGKEGFVGGSPATSCSYTFDGANRLREATISSTPAAYWYDQDGRRVKETVAGKTTWFLYDGLSVIAEFSDDKEPDSVIVPGVSRTRLDLHEPLTEYYLLDGLGSVAQLTDELGNITQEYFYDVFGAARNVKRDPFNRYRFVSLAHDDLTGLIYMNARWYEPGVGRFVSRDPVAGSRTTTQEPNGYVYSVNNPVSFTDTTGLFLEDLVKDVVEKAEELWERSAGVREACTEYWEIAKSLPGYLARIAARGADPGDMLVGAAAAMAADNAGSRERASEAIKPTPDAIKHCVWACLLYAGTGDAKLVLEMTSAWEEARGDETPDDRHNNRVGLSLAKRARSGKEGTCEDLCRREHERLKPGW